MRDRRMDRPTRHTFLPWSLLLLATLYDHMIMYVGLRSCLSCFNVFFHVSVFYSLLCVVVFYLWHFIDLFSCIAASLFNKLTYLLTLMTAHDDDTSSTLACHPSGAGRRTGICQRRGHTGRDETTELGNVLVYTSMLDRLSMARRHHHYQLTDFMGGRSRHNAPAERRRRRGPTRLRSLDVSYSSCRRPVLWALCFSGSLSSDYSVISIVWCVISINKLIDWLIDWSFDAQNDFYRRNAILAQVLAMALCLCLSQVGVLSKRSSESGWFWHGSSLRPILQSVIRWI